MQGNVKEMGMKEASSIKFGIIMFSLFLTAMVIIPIVSAAEQENIQISQESDKFYNWAYQNEGKTVTAAQCLEQSALGYWVNLSDEKKKIYADIKVDLPNFHKRVDSHKQTQFNAVSTTLSQPAEISKSMVFPLSTTVIYVATANSGTGVIPLSINYWASTSNSPCAFPATTVIAQLMKWDGSQWLLVNQGTDTQYYSSFVEIWMNKLVPSQGTYVTYSQHYGDFPAGAIPSAYYLTRWSNQVIYS